MDGGHEKLNLVQRWSVSSVQSAKKNIDLEEFR